MNSVKRLFDIVLAAISLLFAVPVCVAIAIFILVTDGSPVLFVQERVGRHGRLFRILKFRTMTVINDASHFEPGEKSRVTRIGRILRRTKLDELPQLWNVLMGQMSLVGPRPEVPDWVAAYPLRWATVHSVRPGITDPASIEYRNEEQLLAASSDPTETYRDVILPRKLDLYEQYVHSRSFLGDLLILCRTMRAIFR